MPRTPAAFLSSSWLILRTAVRGLAAAVLFVLGAVLIYGFGAGYFGHFSVPTPFNVIASVLLLVLLVAGLRRFLPTTK